MLFCIEPALVALGNLGLMFPIQNGNNASRYTRWTIFPRDNGNIILQLFIEASMFIKTDKNATKCFDTHYSLHKWITLKIFTRWESKIESWNEELCFMFSGTLKKICFLTWIHLIDVNINFKLPIFLKFHKLKRRYLFKI